MRAIEDAPTPHPRLLSPQGERGERHRTEAKQNWNLERIYERECEEPVVVRSEHCEGRDRRFLPQDDPAPPTPQPGHVHGLRRQHSDDGVVDPGVGWTR